MTERLADYVEVAERIAEFHRRHPDGTLQGTWDIREIGERLFVIYEAKAYRNPQDQRPGEGRAWEPFPGPTPYTRDSELMNAETAAWGRALVAIGIVASRKLASSEELLARGVAPYPDPEKPAGQPSNGEPKGKPSHGPSEAQTRMIHALLDERHVMGQDLQNLLDEYGIQLEPGWTGRLTGGKQGTASRVIDWLQKQERKAPA